MAQNVTHILMGQYILKVYTPFPLLLSGVARSLPLGGGGQIASAARKYGCPGACPRENFWGAHPSDAR